MLKNLSDKALKNLPGRQVLIKQNVLLSEIKIIGIWPYALSFIKRIYGLHIFFF